MDKQRAEDFALQITLELIKNQPSVIFEGSRKPAVELISQFAKSLCNTLQKEFADKNDV